MSSVRFGDFEFNEITLELRKNGILLRIQQQPARILAFLLRHRGSLVTREQIRRAIWGEDTFVDFEQGLNFCIRQIRLALSDQADHPQYIETLPRLGYRFICPVEGAIEQPATRKENRIRLAVVPIEDFSGASENYFAAGLTDDMLSALSRIDPERLRVTTLPPLANSSEAVVQIDQFQRQFKLDYLLRGSVRRSVQRIRISAQLYDLRDRSVLWSETYDRESGDLLALQEEVAERVSQSLSVELLRQVSAGSRQYSKSSDAYDAYLKGRFFWHKMTAEGIRRSMGYFREALSLDSGFAPAYAGLADCYAQMGSIRVAQMKPIEALANARSFLQKAFDLDDQLAEAYCTQGLIKSWYEWDWKGAERAFEIALGLNPSMVAALLWQSVFLSALGKFKESVASAKRARDVEPLSAGVNLYLGMAQMLAGQYDLGLRQIQHSIELDPGYYRAHMFLGRFLNWMTKYDEARAELEKALSLDPGNIESVAFLGVSLAGKGDRPAALEVIEKLREAEVRTEPALLIALIHAKLGNVEEMYHWLQNALAVKSTPIYILTISEELSPYLLESRFQAILASVGLQRSALMPPLG